MKKILIITLFVFSLLILLKYRFTDYNVSYKVDNYNIKTIYKKRRIYYEINDGKYIYNFDVYKNRSFNKDMISNIKLINDNNFNCIYPVIKEIETYPLCYLNDEYVDYNLIDSELLDDYKKEVKDNSKNNNDFTYYNNLDNNEYAALWNYKGYIVINGNEYKNVELFKKDKYDNSLSYIIDNTIYMPNNDEEHEFTKLITLNLETLEKGEIDLKYSIDFDSYIVGNIDDKLYLYDNKFSVLYEIDIRKGKTNIIGNNEKGYVKYENNEFVSCSKSLYKVDKIKINNNKSYYSYSPDGMYKTFNEKDDLNLKISNTKIKIIKENNNTIYYQSKDSFYKYNPIYGNKIIFYSYELAFNSDNTIFMFNK